MTTITIYGQRSIPENHLAFPVLITLDNGISGSGFYLNSSNVIYFITAGHILMENKITSKKAILLSYSAIEEFGKKSIIVLDLKKVFESEGIKIDINNDVAAIRIGELTDSLINIKDTPYIVKEETNASRLQGINDYQIKKYDDVLIANDIFIFGYPKSIGIKEIPQIDYSRPLVKKGIVAGKNDKMKRLILDCEVFFGNSGGIVLEIDDRFVERESFAIGVITQMIPFAEIIENKTYGYQSPVLSNSGYSVATPMDFVLELISSFKN